MTTSEKNKLVETFVNITIAEKCSRCDYRHNDSLCPKFVQYDEDNAFNVCKEGITAFWDNYLTEIQEEINNG